MVGGSFAQSELASTDTRSRLAAGCRSRVAASPYGQGGQPGTGRSGQPAYGQSPYGQDYGSSAYANYQELEKKKSPIGWWIAGAALVIVIVVVAVIAIRAVTGGDTGTTGGGPVAQPSQDVCPPQNTASPDAPATHPADGRVHGGPVSYPMLGPPWGPPQGPPNPVPFGSDVQSQMVLDQLNYDGKGNNWVASILVGELQAGDGFFTPEQGSQIVVKCILGAFYGNHPINSDVKVNEKTTIDGHEAWLVESQLTFDIPRLEAKGECSSWQSSPPATGQVSTTPRSPIPARTRAARPGRPEAAAGRRLAAEV